MSKFKITATSRLGKEPVAFQGDYLEDMKELFQVMDASARYDDIELRSNRGDLLEKQEDWRLGECRG